MSKTDGLRAMREKQFTERSRPQKGERKKPEPEVIKEIKKLIDPPAPKIDLAPAKPAPNVATKRKKRTAEMIGKTREGQRQISLWVDDAMARRLKMEAAARGITMQDLMKGAIQVELDR